MWNPMRRWLGLVLWGGLLVSLTACGVSGDPEATTTPDRPLVRAAVYEVNPESRLTVTLTDLSLLQTGADSDTQILAVLADGQGNPSYLLYPSNQPGIPETTISLFDYSLKIQPQGNEARLWVVALRHQAYPVSESLGQAGIAERLALTFDRQFPSSAQPLATVVAANGSDLLGWFGEIDILGEINVSLTATTNWSEGENQTTAPVGGLALSYTVQAEPPALALAPSPEIVLTTPAMTPSPTIPPTLLTPSTFTTAFGQPIEGYKMVVSENFQGARSTVQWFTGSDSTYATSIINGAYQIALIEIDPNREVGLSWGSIQDLFFDDYVVRARMRVLQDVTARYGLWLHYQNDFNFVFFGLENTGRYRVARFKNVYTELAPWTSDALVRTGTQTNELEISLLGREYSLKVNGEPVVSTADGAFFSGRIAFFCYAEIVPATCHLEAIEIWIPDDYRFPRPTSTPAP